jgi:catechol 2,3-dioxygenase-like lactoylglutathione lyase family enzyme
MLRTDHMVFPVWDAEASITFYADVLGLPLVAAHQGDDWGGKRWLMMVFAVGDGRELVLVALQGAQRPPAGDLAADIRHYAFSVATIDEQAAWIAKLKAAEVDFWEEDHGAQHSVYFADPNGVILEITTPASNPASAPDPAARAAARLWIEQAHALTR